MDSLEPLGLKGALRHYVLPRLAAAKRLLLVTRCLREVRVGARISTLSQGRGIQTNKLQLVINN